MPTTSLPVAEVESYYDHPRPEVVGVVPRDARQVIDIGCGAGALGRALKKERPGIQVRGIEIVPDQAARARCVLDDCRVGAAEDPLPEGWPRPDCIIFADVLEHLVDPWTVLRSWRQWLVPGGAVVVSIPNVRHRSVLGGLLRGRWDYADEGILDRTHLRFFTRGTAVELVESAGFRVEHAQRSVDGPFGALARWLPPGHPGKGTRTPLVDLVCDLFTVQNLIVAR
jgi:O-antigen biosynthesis protein